MGRGDRRNSLYLPDRCSMQEIEQAVHEIWIHLYDKGGVIAQCEFGLEAKPENVLTVFESWNSLDLSEE